MHTAIAGLHRFHIVFIFFGINIFFCSLVCRLCIVGSVADTDCHYMLDDEYVTMVLLNCVFCYSYISLCVLLQHFTYR